MANSHFQNWLENYGGPEKLARKLGVTVYVVNRWKRRAGWPKVENLIEIQKLSKGELTLEQIIESTRPNTKKRK